MKKNAPIKIINYLILEFCYSLLTVILVFISLSLLINFVEEIAFFKERKVENIIILLSYLSLIKTPNTLLELSIFIFLFSGILFFVKIQKSNEINTILLSGISKLLPIVTIGVFSFVLGIFIISTISPISSSLLKIYEKTKRNYSNDNLIVINKQGLWFMEILPNEYNIVRADNISNNNFSKLSNVTIYNLDKNFNFLKRTDSQIAKISNKNWNLENSIIVSNNENAEIKHNIYPSITYNSSINIEDLKEYFSNANTVSFWEIANSIENLNARGYSADELKIKFHKYLSLPFYLFGMILLSTLFTIAINREYNTLMYLFFGLIAGFLIFFLNDLSIAVGLSNKLPLAIAVWAPVMIIMLLSIFNLIKIHEK